MSRGPARSGRSSSARSRTRAGTTGESRSRSETPHERRRDATGRDPGLARGGGRRGQRGAGAGRLVAPADDGARPRLPSSWRPTFGRCLLRHRRHLRSRLVAPPHAALAGALSGAASRRSASATTRTSWSTTPWASTARRASGGCSACSGTLASRSSPVACRAGRRKAHPVARDAPAIVPGSFTARARDDALVRSFEQVRTTLSDKGAQIVDARAAARFTGEDPGPRPDLPRGHIPGSRNVPFDAVLDDDGRRAERCRGRSAAPSPTPVSTRPSRLSPPADRASPRVYWPSRSPPSGPSATSLFDGLLDSDARYHPWTDWGSRADAPVESGRP